MATLKTQCPTCGAKLPDRPLSICPYCVMPLELGAAGEAAETESKNRARIDKIKDNAKYEGAMTHTPSETPDFVLGGSRIYRGKLCLVFAALFMVVAWLMSDSVLEIFIGIVPLFAYALAIFGIYSIILGKKMRRDAVALPLVKRPALILDRASTTTLNGWRGSTAYTFTIEFQDGSVGDFTYPGRGSNEEPYVNGLTGIAYTRGPILLEFQHVRV